MARLEHNFDFPNGNLKALIEKLIYQTKYLKGEYLSDTRAQEIFNWYLDKLKILKKLVSRDVRLNYLQIQEEMDRLFKIDPYSDGFNIILSYQNATDCHYHRIKGTIKKDKKI